MLTGAMSLPQKQVFGRRYLLLKDIPAVQLFTAGEGEACWGPLVRLPRGAELFSSDEGLQDGTLRITFGGFPYLVFPEDLASASG